MRVSRRRTANIRMPGIAPKGEGGRKGEAKRAIAACSLLVLNLTDQYPGQSLPQYIIRIVPPCPAYAPRCKARPAHIIQDANKFQRGEWQYLCYEAVKEGTKLKHHFITDMQLTKTGEFLDTGPSASSSL